MKDSEKKMLECDHHNARVNEQLLTFHCPDCGLTKKLPLASVTMAKLVIDTMGPMVDEKDQAQALVQSIAEKYHTATGWLALLALAVCGLRDTCGTEEPKVLWAAQAYYKLARLRYIEAKKEGAEEVSLT